MLCYIGKVENRKGYSHYLCQCGQSVQRKTYDVLKKKTDSCGCLTKLRSKGVNKTHGESKTYLYKLWCNIKQRCYNEKHSSFYRYGARGIKVCDEWLNDYQKFKSYVLNHLGERPKNQSLDRINNDGDYAPGNVRWASSKIQQNNTNWSISEEDIKEMQKMRQQGKKLKEIAPIFGCNLGTVSKYTKGIKN